MADALSLFASSFAPPVGLTGGGARTALAIPSLTGSAGAFLAATLAASGEDRLVLAVTPGIPDAEKLAADLEALAAAGLAKNLRILELPAIADGDRNAVGVRLKTLAVIRAWSLKPYPAVVVVAFPVLAAPLSLDPAAVRTFDLGPDTKFAAYARALQELGYERIAQVEKPGDYSVRGGIIDAWSPGEEFPVRAEFFGEELESIRSFGVGTQTSIARLDGFTLLPARETTVAGPVRSTILDLLPAAAMVLALEHNEYDLGPLASAAAPRNWIYTGEPAPAGVATYRFLTTALPGFSELGAYEAHHPELFAAARERLERHLAAAAGRSVAVVELAELSGGFEIDGVLIVVTRSDRVFARRPTRRNRRVEPAGERLAGFDDLELGEYVVHVDHGIGRYIGSEEILAGDRRVEVFTIEYAGGARLHVPVTHAHLLSRYVGVKGEAVRLHRLDGRRWNRDKAEAQQAVADLAASLLETQARRELVPGFAYDVNCEGRAEFEAAFPYAETADQTAAIAAVMKDLAAAKPMDRLICGDAGYGKTEVAMRAAFVAAMNGKQVAVLAPTTVLAEQHFETFTVRFDGTPVRIESVSRFQGAATHAGTFQRLASGACDIVIGTHAILSEKIVFRDLGLIIIDEEQRFGVRHKEFLKRLRSTADVLTLSATPIPRTLYLSMTGARDLSLLRTPPGERVAVDTKVVSDSDVIVKAAIEAELARGGQVFFLHNRVTTLGKVEKRLKAICPGARLTVAHGQLDARTLARKMREFERGASDVLVSTTIVESGIDIPRANTILVDHAEMFGLADLYQLRGRVGRSAREGRAIFLLPPGGIVDSDARERLKALQRHGGLGAGFDLAVRDLELRGAGNLLGSQQSGHIAAVGFSLYCQLLQRTVALLRGERPAEVVDVRLNFDFLDLSPASADEASAAALPYSYIEEDSLRMGFLRRFAAASDRSAVRSLAAELKDRFGPLPPAARRFVRVAELRVVAAAAGIRVIDVKGDRAICYRGNRQIARVVDLKGNSADRKLSSLLTSLTARR